MKKNYFMVKAAFLSAAAVLPVLLGSCSKKNVQSDAPDSGTMTISSITCSGNTATTGKDIYISDATLNIGGRIGSSVDIYMNNTAANNTSQALVPVEGGCRHTS